MTEQVGFVELLHRTCRQHGWALLLTAEHSPRGFAEPSRTELRNLDVVKPATFAQQLAAAAITYRPLSRRQKLTAGELVVRCRLDAVSGDLEAAAELLVGLLTQARERAA